MLLLVFRREFENTLGEHSSLDRLFPFCAPITRFTHYNGLDCIYECDPSICCFVLLKITGYTRLVTRLS